VVSRFTGSPWVLPLAVSALLLSVLLFLFPYNSGDSSLHEPLGFALWTTWVDVSTDAPDHSYCLLVPLMVGYLLFNKRKQIAATTLRPSAIGLLWILIGLALFWIGSRAGKQYVGCGGIQIILLGFIYWFWGSAVFRQLLFAWTILTFAWPLPFLDTTVAFPLRMIVSHSAYEALNLLGLPCLQSGTALLSAPTTALPMGAKFQIDVADPCSGLRSLLPLLMFSSFYVYFFLSLEWQRWTVFLSAFLFTIAANVVRILLLVIGCLLFGSAFAIGTNESPSTYHEACGFAVFVMVIGLECGFGLLIRRWSPVRAVAESKPTAPTGPTATKSPPVVIPMARQNGVILALTIVALLVFFVTPPVFLPTEAGVLMRLPNDVPVPSLGDFYGTIAPVSEVEHRLLPKDTEYARKTYDDLHHHQIFLSIVLSGVQQYTIHPPEICLVAQGWSIKGQEDIPIALQSAHRLIVRNLDLQRLVTDRAGNPHVLKSCYMYWYVADDLTTQSHLQRNIMSSWDRVVHNRDHRWAYVFAMSPVTESFLPNGLSVEGTRKLLSDFVREVVPTFVKSEIPATTDLSRE
jgi:exosortase